MNEMYAEMVGSTDARGEPVLSLGKEGSDDRARYVVVGGMKWVMRRRMDWLVGGDYDSSMMDRKRVVWWGHRWGR